MKTKALITMLVLATSSAAMAAPSLKVSAGAELSIRRSGQVRERAYDPRLDDNFHRPYTSNIKLNLDSSEYVGPVYTMNQRFGWATLTEPTRIEKGREIIRVNGSFHAFMLQGVTGTTKVDLVKVRFKDGRTQAIQVDKNLSMARSIYFGVDRGAIDYIVVYGSMNANATYKVLGS